MATLRTLKRQGGIVWMVDFRIQGKRYRKSTKTSDRKEAELILKKIEVEIANGTFGFEILDRKRILLSEFIQKYLDYAKATKADNTVAVDERVLRQFRKFLGDLPLCRIQPGELETYKIHRLASIKPSSVNVELKHLKSAFESAVRWGYLKENPFRPIKLLKVKGSNHPKYFSQEEVGRLLDAIPEGRFKDLVLFYLYTGARRNEALNMTWDDVDMKGGRITFRQTKSGKNRLVPFNGVLTDVFRRMEKTGEKPFPFLPDFVTKTFKKVVKESGVKDLSVHSLRHTFASHMVMAGVDIKTVSELLGHSSVRVTEMYAHLMPSHLKASVERLRY